MYLHNKTALMRLVLLLGVVIVFAAATGAQPHGGGEGGTARRFQVANNKFYKDGKALQIISGRYVN